MKERPILSSGVDRARFWAKVNVTPDDGCWLWDASRNQKGYGRFSLAGRMTTAHRASWLLNNAAQIPDGWTVDHLCRNRACVRPDHLEAVPHRVNLLRGNTVTARAAATTQCPAGHPYNNTNTLRRKRGGRTCRACDRARAAKAYIQRGKPRRRRPHLTHEDRSLIRDLIEQGHSHEAIAERLTISTATVSRVRHSHA